MENELYSVYVKTNANGYVTAIHSSDFISDTTGWTKIDEGEGDRYRHAQGNYLADALLTDSGVYRYKLVDGVVTECTPEEIAEQEAANTPESPGSGSTAETPVFDLVSMGLPAVPVPVGYVSMEADTSEIRAALNKGPALFLLAVTHNNQTTQVMLTMAGVGDGSWYQQVTVTAFGGSAIVIVTVTENSISVSSSSPDTIMGVPASIDLSSYESDGEIVETFPDGSVKTTVMEFNSDGKPTKITDRNGNVTTLTW